MNPSAGKWLIVIGLCIAATGAAIWLFHDKLHWIGRLPGDIRIERENFRFYFPITTMILASVLVSLLVHFIRRLF